ncbi:MAG TPA: Xaa-Pro peptidase family protein [Candidatus Limnocylindria bacterium]|nr:Xaa-Pro peptidase family protein [Candidatus Limnocylindria bacterium]
MKMRPLALRASLVLLALSLSSYLAQARFPQPKEEYQARREKLRTQVDGPVVLFGYTSRQEGGEVAVFFQDENFYYLSGYDEPDAALLLIPDPPDGKKLEGPSEILYLPPRDPRRAKWEGPKLGPEDPGAAEKTGFQAVKPYANLRGDLVGLSKSYPNFYTPLATRPENGYPHLATSNAWLRDALPGANVLDVTAALTAMRMVKSAGELALLQKAVDASVDAQLAAMKMLRPGLYEYQVAARMKEIHEWAGCSREAYAPIVGAGFYSTVLHYDALKNEIKDGDVVVLDVAGEYGGYAADITRTIPANGKFTLRQREIYEIVLGAQNAALAATKAGVRPGELDQIARNYINSNGKDLHGNSLGQYFIHGLGHGLGLDVHDPTDYTRPLQAGMVITNEPGIYIPEENLGVRIEDDVLVTRDGYELLTRRLPRNAEEIEKIMAQARTHSQP